MGQLGQWSQMMHTSTHAATGQHLLLDLYGCDAALLSSLEQLTLLIKNAAHRANATIINSHFHHFGHQLGVTGVLLLKESHMSIHTWPEHGYAAIDIFMCGDAEVDQAKTYLLAAFKPDQHTSQKINRGLYSNVFPPVPA
ncbi:hypothetical protein GCM10009007_06480 [Formosimonas limnophila]|uniref:S-adenosylmethionine decarboxylase proenzyme n=2 Tax=Formosimonas limnophila TaxID=1384487 RepID=A0A8J3G0D2_9BURK|nr:hypothetical protein GCM10009007_06480 [Formosimonas limnophila]